MNPQEMQKEIQKQSFIQNNGKIMRTLNILKRKEGTISNIRVLMKDTPSEDIQNSLLYLQESGYLRIAHPEGAACYTSSESQGEISITSKGMALLMGVADDLAVDI